MSKTLATENNFQHGWWKNDYANTASICHFCFQVTETFQRQRVPSRCGETALYPGSLCGKLKRIVTLPRRLQIKWYRPWLYSSSPIYPPIQDLKWFFFLLINGLLFHQCSCVYNRTQETLWSWSVTFGNCTPPSAWLWIWRTGCFIYDLS